MHTGDQRRTIVELSHPIRHRMTTYPGLPGPEIGDHLSREASRGHYGPGTEFQIGRITMVSNTGTYLDTPFHRYEDGADLAGQPLSSLADLEGVTVHRGDRAERAITPDELEPYAVGGRAVVIHTGWDRHWGTPEYGAGGHPYLTAEAAGRLVDRGAVLVGIDSLNVDDTTDPSRPAHTRLLGAGIPVVEHMCGLSRLPAQGFRFHAVPPAVAGMGTFPVRAYAIVTDAETDEPG
jgi:kynurenine formamidase